MTQEKYKIMMNLADMIEGEINRMCVTKDLSELDSMALHAMNNIKKLQSMRNEELEKNRNNDLKNIRAEIDALHGVYDSHFREQVVIKSDVMRILDEHIAELKG